MLAGILLRFYNNIYNYINIYNSINSTNRF